MGRSSVRFSFVHFEFVMSMVLLYGFVGLLSQA